jgi:hypothetical protein
MNIDIARSNINKFQGNHPSSVVQLVDEEYYKVDWDCNEASKELEEPVSLPARIGLRGRSDDWTDYQYARRDKNRKVCAWDKNERRQYRKEITMP